MRLDRYLPEQRRLHADSRKHKLLVVGVVVGIHLFLVAGWTAWATIRERNAPPEEVIRYFDIAVFPSPAAVAAPPAAPSARGEEPRNARTATAPERPESTAPPAPR